MSEELIYLYRRKGNESWATCDADRYSELAGNHFFEVRVARHQHDYAALEAECERLREQHEGAESQTEYQRDRAEHFETERDALRLHLAERDATIERLEAGIPRLQEQSYQARKQREKVAEQAREIERLQLTCNDLDDQNDRIYAELAALKAQPRGVVQWPEADEIMQMAFEEGHPADDASGYYFELEEFDLFIERLMSEVARLNAAHVQQVKCKTCNDNGRIGGPSFYAPDEGGEPCPDCSAPVQQVSVPDGWRDGYRAAMNSAASGARQLYVQHCHHHGVNGLLDRCKELEQSFIRDADAAASAAPAAPAADAGHVFYGMDGNHP